VTGTASVRADPALKSVQRALDLLDVLATADEMSVTDLSRQTGLDKSTVSRQLATLEARRLVLRNDRTNRFALGFKLLELGNRVAQRYGLFQAAEASMRQLRDAVDETVGLYVLVGQVERVCLGQVESRASIRHSLPVGSVLGLLPGAPGKCFLAFAPPSERESLLALALVDVRRRGLAVDPDQLQAELEAARAQGYVSTREEHLPGGAALAFPIYGREGRLAAALSISGLAVRMEGEPLETCIVAGLRHAEALSQTLAYVPTTPR
jgi:DNA-binding IclR family transcriptional regulator